MSGRRYLGSPASPGRAAGQIVRLDRSSLLSERRRGQPAEQADRLKAAVAASCRELVERAKEFDPPVADVVQVQAELLSDPTLLSSAIALLSSGMNAEEAWSEVLQREIDYFGNGGDEVQRARAADFSDVQMKVLQHLSGKVPSTASGPSSALLLVDEATPSMLYDKDRPSFSAIIAERGSANSHAALLARSLHIPMVVNVDLAGSELAGYACLDGETGEVVSDLTEAEYVALEREIFEVDRPDSQTHSNVVLPVSTIDDARVELNVNISHWADVARASACNFDGVGLVRTEFFLREMVEMTSLEYQREIYKRIIEAARGRTVTFRTIDAGGDKPIEGYTREGERNPFLGVRGIRLSLQNTLAFRCQIRALLEASNLGPMRIMLPMVTVPSEFAAARRIIDEEAARISGGVRAASIPVGMMVEVPAAALAIERFSADFYSIGTNDLMQYLTASARDTEDLRHLQTESLPLLYQMVARVAAHGLNMGNAVSVCGELASAPDCTADLLRTGIRSLSVDLERLTHVADAIRATDLRVDRP